MKPAVHAALTAVLVLVAVLATGCQRNGTTRNASNPKEDTMSNVIHITTPAFDKVKAQSKPVLIDFWAPWCGPCRIQGPIVDQVSIQVGDKAIVGKVNVDEEQALAAQFGVQAIPTLVIMKDGKVAQRFVGVQQAEGLVASLQAVE
jgi:thioredoxin 1